MSRMTPLCGLKVRRRQKRLGTVSGAKHSQMSGGRRAGMGAEDTRNSSRIVLCVLHWA